jgi:glucose-6-phosphate-specific signal transduction histidine kinase
MHVSRFWLIATILLVPVSLVMAYLKIERGSGSFHWAFDLLLAGVAAVWACYQCYIIWAQKRYWRKLALKSVNEAGKAILTSGRARRAAKAEIANFRNASGRPFSEGDTNA